MILYLKIENLISSPTYCCDSDTLVTTGLFESDLKGHFELRFDHEQLNWIFFWVF